MTAAQDLITSAFVAETLRFPPASQPVVGFTAVSTDSRKVPAGCLFVAIAGETFDGHSFIPQALEKGARGILCRKGGFAGSKPPGVAIFEVGDTVDAYRQIAAAWRQKFRIPVVLVAGSVGKTTTKELLSSILEGKWSQVLRTQGSQNGFVGIPMTLLELRSTHGAAVIEVGIDEMGAMEKHMPVVDPTLSTLTAIGPEHLEKLRDVPTVAYEEAVALRWTAKKGGALVINLDDPWIGPLWNELQSEHKRGFTLRQKPVAGILSGTASPDGSELRVSGKGGFGSEVFISPLPGAHNLGNLLNAITVATLLGLTPEEIRSGLAGFRGAAGRSEMKTLGGKLPVVCDYYNASPPSMAAGLALLSEIAARSQPPKRRWACLGDMLELGPKEESFHRELAQVITRLGIENVLLYGNRMKWLESELKKTPAPPARVQHFATQTELAGALLKDVKPETDAVLIKGSRSMKMEEVLKVLEKRFSP